jgi:hypothetical protein
MSSRRGGVRGPVGGERFLRLVLHSPQLLPQPPGIFARVIGEAGERGIQPLEEAAFRARVTRAVVTRVVNPGLLVDKATGAG